MRTGHLFAGGGGGLYADLILGHTPVFAVEWDPYAAAVLRSRVADGWFPGLRVHEIDARLFDPSEYAGRVDCIHAGFPCQDISAAGKGTGITGSRSGLYVEVMRAIDAIRPEWVMLENSPLIRTRGRHVVIADLVARGYSWRDGILSAADVGAPHKRDRWWRLAHTDHAGQSPDQRQGQARDDLGRVREAMADADSQRSECLRLHEGRPEAGERQELGGCSLSLAGSEGLEERDGPAGERPHPAAPGGGWWSAEPDVGRLAHGMANRSHQIKCLGNGQVPLCAAAAWKLLGGP